MQDDHTVAPVHSADGVAVLTALCQVLTVEVVVIAFADLAVEGRVRRFCYIQLNTPERALTVHISRIIVIETGTVQQGLLAVPVIDPNERQIGGANRCDGVCLRMNNQ